MHIIDAGNIIHLDIKGSYIQSSATGWNVKIDHEDGGFYFNNYVPKSQQARVEAVRRDKREPSNNFKALEEYDGDEDKGLGLFSTKSGS